MVIQKKATIEYIDKDTVIIYGLPYMAVYADTKIKELFFDNGVTIELGKSVLDSKREIIAIEEANDCTKPHAVLIKSKLTNNG